ncbi:T9SS type A sorting domain-containing protein [candidate division KSB1 bacterium]|nr:T9SS type A sorting domain-containing protein [candidate division KSB1 bacterium]
MNGGAAFSGVLDELRFYERMLTDEEILALYIYDPASAVEPEKNSMAENFALHQNYPNPFNPATKITYSLPYARHVSLRVYDILGNEVGTLVDEFQTAQTYTVDFDAGNLPSGVYFSKLWVGDRIVDIKKMLLVR